MQYALCHFPLQHPFVCDAFPGEALPERGIQIEKYLPHTQELFFLLRALILYDYAPELLQGIFLVFIQKIIAGIQLPQIFDVGKELGRIGHIFVHIAEICNHGLAQRDKAVKTLKLTAAPAAYPGIHLPEDVDELYLVSSAVRTEPGKKVAYGYDVGRKHRNAAALPQIFLEKERRAAAGKHKQAAAQIRVLLGRVGLCNLIQEAILHLPGIFPIVFQLQIYRDI